MSGCEGIQGTQRWGFGCGVSRNREQLLLHERQRRVRVSRVGARRRVGHVTSGRRRARRCGQTLALRKRSRQRHEGFKSPSCLRGRYQEGGLGATRRRRAPRRRRLASRLAHHPLNERGVGGNAHQPGDVLVPLASPRRRRQARPWRPGMRPQRRLEGGAAGRGRDNSGAGRGAVSLIRRGSCHGGHGGRDGSSGGGGGGSSGRWGRRNIV